MTTNRKKDFPGWFVGIIAALALLAVGYLVFGANDPIPQVTQVEVAP